MREPYWSDQKYGALTGAPWSIPPASKVATAIAGRSSAPVQCSTRWRRAGRRVVPSGAVTDGDDVRDRRLAVGSAEHAVAEFESAAPKPFDVRDAADTDDHDVGR